MSTKHLLLPEDPRWLEFCREYSGSAERFAREVQGIDPSDQQVELFACVSASRSRTSVASGHGCFGLGTMIMRADGTCIPVEDICVGDRLMGPDGASARNVLELRRGREPMYRFTYADGSSHVFNESHILCLTNLSGLWEESLSTAVVRDWLDWPECKRAAHWCYRWHPDGYIPLTIVSVEPLGEGNYYGFVLDGDNRFLGGDFTVLHNTGKTTSIANIVLWHLLCYPMSVTLLTANDMDQLKATLWKEIGVALERIRRGPHGWIAEHVEILANASCRVIGFEKVWFVESKTANEKTANKMAGRHGEWLLIIGDEASTLPDAVVTTLTGALTEQHNRMLLTSQPTRNAGYFYRTHHDLSIQNGGEWVPLVFDSFDSPFVSDDSLMELWNAYDDDERNVRLLGRFPQDSSKHMMSLKVSEAMYRRGRIISNDELYGWLVLGDIASGEGLRDKSSCVVVRVIGYGDTGPEARRVEVVGIPALTNRIKSNVFASTLADSGSDLSNATYVADSGGLGVNVCQDLEDMGKVVHRVNWGNPCFKKMNQGRYLNLRAQAMHHAARAAKEGRLSILTSDFKKVMLDQSSRIPKAFTDKGRIKVPQKGSTEWDGLGSPDLWDAVCFAFLENVSYVVAEAAGGESAGLAESLADEVNDLFADIA